MKLDDLRGAVRPIVTLALVAAAIVGFLAVVLAFFLGRVSVGDFTQLVKDFGQLVSIVTMFWFAQRQQEKQEDADAGLTTSKSVTATTTTTKQGDPTS